MALSGELVKFVGGELAKNAGKGAAVSTLSSLAPKAITSAVTSTLPKAVTKSVLSSIVPKATEAPITLYRGLTQKYDPNYPVAKLDTSGYESWTDNPELAKQYGDYVYSIDVPKTDIKTSYLDENPASPTYGDRNPIYSIDKKAGLNGVSGNEYLLEVGSDYQKGLKYNPVSPAATGESVGSLSSLGSELSGMNANEINDFTQAAIRANVNPEVATRAMEFLPRNKAVENPGVIMENGKPMKLYHSTPTEFDKFDDSYIGKNTMYDSAKLGHFATPDHDFSSRFADIDNTGKPGYTMEVQIQSKKPIVHPYGAGLKYGPVDVDNIVRTYYHELGLDDVIDELAETAAENGTSLYDEYMNLTFGGENPFEVAETERRALMDKGYDSLELVEGRKRDLVEGSQDASPVSSYVAFEGKNINKVKHLPVERNGEGTDIAIHRGDVSQQIAADPRLKRLRQSPVRDLLGQEQIDAYKAAQEGSLFGEDFLKNDPFYTDLQDKMTVANKNKYITHDMEDNPDLIPMEKLQELQNISKDFIRKNIKGVGQDRKAVIVVGRPSSGKSSGAVNQYSVRKKAENGGDFFELDNDEIKKLIPGYENGIGASAVQEASSLMGKKMVLPELAQGGYNIVLPIVGQKEKSVMNYVDTLANAGYEIALVNTTLPVDSCRTRNRTRSYETGRGVPDDYIVSVGNKPDEVYNKIVNDIKNGKERRISSYAAVSTDVDFGAPARVIENSGSELLARLNH